MVKMKNARKLLKQTPKRGGETSVIVNSELQDPRSQPQPSRPPIPSQPPPRVPSTSNGQAVMNSNIIQKKGTPKPPPHRPGALPMPPGMELTRSGIDPHNIGQKKGLLQMPLPSVSEDEDR